MSRLRTSLCELLGIEVPIVQAPIGSATTPELAAAISNEGALGTLAASWRDLDSLRAIVTRTKELTNRPFAVNVVLEWDQRARVELALDLGVRIISTFWGDSSPFVELVHRSGGLLLHTVGSADEGRRAIETGVDVVVIQGVEAGGHVRGSTPVKALLAELTSAPCPIPIVAAGNSATGRDVASLLASGASGVWMGTRFLCSEEANVADVYRTAILEAGENDTVLTTLFDKGWPNAPHRVVRNSTVRRWEAAGSPPPGKRPGENDTVARDVNGAPIERYSDTIPTRDVSGEVEALALYAGRSCSRIRSVRPAREIIRSLVREALDVLEEVYPEG